MNILDMFGLNPWSPPKDAEVAEQVEQNRKAAVNVGKDIKTSYEAQKATFSWFPIMSEYYDLIEQHYGALAVDLAVDLFGQKLAGKTLGFVLPVAYSTFKTVFKGVGREALEKIVMKCGNISEHLTEKDITGAIKDIFGKPIKIGNKTYNHLDEVTNAIKGIENQIQKLNKEINSGTFTDDVLEEAERIRSGLQKEKDKVQNLLNKAEKAAKEKSGD